MRGEEKEGFSRPVGMKKAQLGSWAWGCRRKLLANDIRIIEDVTNNYKGFWISRFSKIMSVKPSCPKQFKGSKPITPSDYDIIVYSIRKYITLENICSVSISQACVLAECIRINFIWPRYVSSIMNKMAPPFCINRKRV